MCAVKDLYGTISEDVQMYLLSLNCYDLIFHLSFGRWHMIYWSFYIFC
jgi:hypothetical protein